MLNNRNHKKILNETYFNTYIKSIEKSCRFCAYCYLFCSNNNFFFRSNIANLHTQLRKYVDNEGDYIIK